MAGLLRWTVVAGLSVAALGGLPAVSGGVTVGGDPAGVRLAREVDAAYGDVAGIRATGYVPGQGNRHLHIVITYALGEGLLTAMGTTFVLPSGTYSAVEVPAGSFDRDPGSTCWRRVGPATHLGTSAMTTAGDRFLAPRRRGSALELTQIQKDGTHAVHLISPTTKRLISTRVVFGDGARLVIRAYAVLPRTPAITAPTPRCRPGAKATP